MPAVAASSSRNDSLAKVLETPPSDRRAVDRRNRYRSGAAGTLECGPVASKLRTRWANTLRLGNAQVTGAAFRPPEFPAAVGACVPFCPYSSGLGESRPLW